MVKEINLFQCTFQDKVSSKHTLEQFICQNLYSSNFDAIKNIETCTSEVEAYPICVQLKLEYIQKAHLLKNCLYSIETLLEKRNTFKNDLE